MPTDTRFFTQARFAAPCFPGETLIVDIWRQDSQGQQQQRQSGQDRDTEIYVFEVSVHRKGKVSVVRNAFVELSQAASSDSKASGVRLNSRL